MKKQREEKNFERLAIDAEQACKVQIEKIRGLDYVNTRVEAIKERFSEEEQIIEKLIKHSEEVENQIDEAFKQRKSDYATLKKQLTNDLHLDKDSFLFPEGTPSETYNIQLAGLKAANLCENCHTELVKLSNELDAGLQERKQKNRKLTECSVVIDIDDINKKSVEDIKNALRNVVPDDALQGYSESLKNFKRIYVDYETAKKHCAALNAAGIKAIVKNNVCSEAMMSDYDNITETYTQPINEAKEKIDNYKIPLHLSSIENNMWKWIGGTVIAWIILAGFVTMIMINTGHNNSTADLLIMFLVPLPIAAIPISIALISHIVSNKKYSQKCRQLENLKATVDSLINRIINEITLQCNLYKVYTRAEKEVISEFYEKCKQVEQTNERLLKKLANFYNWVSTQNGELLEYLPSNLDRQLLPRMVELMERGAATDYKTALQLATQEEKAEREFAEQRRIIEREQANRTAEIQAQRLMQEYYEKQRLDLAREQAESQKRAEQYAKQQAETAERQREAAEAAAKAAEKQAEDTEEFLRRTNDPYYINQWKNS